MMIAAAALAMHVLRVVHWNRSRLYAKLEKKTGSRNLGGFDCACNAQGISLDQLAKATRLAATTDLKSCG